ncbi:N-acetyl-gamma-glutamyl-phosphate reductase [Breznakia sp. PF5-3]|uniref:N-acetyl-gamma-glutamyl-phosphate reductase n=1 Tax=unclassified Breznakia TaxID=2623764 RepID=UPI002406CC30|nr:MULTISPECIES: N-acetyl-gamma-glutamyl-phosphate reductase [unclassified Breznakia]MDF9825568.1 N-acetyl-gamma-glutamyl-phosphate reductase [Breznakia sp. PM6-1]MDF9835875.1 N-acetyl-gamma-glutamyl-phosphate reductase [Breznakia sp. PF5-3]MDF9837620.1 N-acetyl-gamma-glutamyl-phosphate reductase [Breznakia sp. PFB2-8]MDF9859999.1 N-acetyl-gamma-glutamyl-phosphate reductase [Breznakia sp. PH5-24]
MKKLKVGIIGASGYAGAELLRLLLTHPMVEISGIYSRSYQGKQISDLYPGFQNITNLVFSDEDLLIQNSDIVFASLPHGISEQYAKKCHEQHKKFIDLGADFRLYDEADYKTWYKLSYHQPELHKESVYGLSEIYKDAIKNASIIGNPGCYPTSIAFALYPILKHGIQQDNHFIIDAKSGVTGAGKEPSETTHFANVNEGFHPYKVAEHRHTPEIEQTLSAMANTNISVTFVPHLLPIDRGIISTVYIRIGKEQTLEQLHTLYSNVYQAHKFIRVLPLNKTTNLKYVQYSNYCDLSLHLDTRSNTLIVVAAIDNMVKGAAGQAIQNMNIMYDLEEDMGLTFIPPSF